MRRIGMRISLAIACAVLVALAPGAVRAAGSVPLASPAALRQLHGVVVAVSGNVLTLRLRSGEEETVDLTPANAAHHAGILPKGHAVVVFGNRDAQGVFHVVSVGHTSQDAATWSPDT
jgi:hypothetical protein